MGYVSSLEGIYDSPCVPKGTFATKKVLTLSPVRRLNKIQEAQNCRNVSFLFEYVGVRTKSPSEKKVSTRIAGFGGGTPY